MAVSSMTKAARQFLPAKGLGNCTLLRSRVGIIGIAGIHSLMPIHD